MSERREQWTDLLSEYLNGGLSHDERRDVEAHLEGCAHCRAVLDELREVVRRAHALEEMLPDRDLWPGIAGAIRTTTGGDASPARDLVPVSARHPSEDGARRSSAGVWLSVPQLAVATIVLMLCSASVTWWAGADRSPTRREGPRAATSTAPLFQPSQASAGLAGVPAGIAEQLAELQDTIAAARGRLDPATERIIRKNLAVIDRAIAESRAALAADPDDPFLEEHLDRTYERKVTYLRQAARIVGGVSAP